MKRKYTHYIDCGRGSYIETPKAIGFRIVSGYTHKETGEMKWFPKSQIEIQDNTVTGWECPERLKILVPAWTVRDLHSRNNRWLDNGTINEM